MTVSSTIRSAAFIGNSSASVFAFGFKVFAPSDVLVVEANSETGLEATMILNTDYTVILNSDQNGYPGGVVTLLAGLLATGYTLVITSAVPSTQNTDLTNSGGFYPEVITAALDRLTILIQQIGTLFAGQLTGTQDGFNTVFTLTNNGVPINRVPRQITAWCNFPLVNGVGYVLGPLAGQVTFLSSAPASDDVLFAQGVM